MRSFEKISFDQFQKDISDDRELYDQFKMPARKTRASAGYDFFSLIDYELQPGEKIVVPTGIKAYFPEDEFLMIVVRSSLGFKHNVRMCNQVGIIDSDYHNSPKNEGHMWISLQNHGDEVFSIKKGEAFCQGIFLRYLTCGEEVTEKREGWSAVEATQKIKSTKEG